MSSQDEDIKSLADSLASLLAVTYSLLAKTTADAPTVARAEKELEAAGQLLDRVRPVAKVGIGANWKLQR